MSRADSVTFLFLSRGAMRFAPTALAGRRSARPVVREAMPAGPWRLGAVSSWAYRLASGTSSARGLGVSPCRSMFMAFQGVSSLTPMVARPFSISDACLCIFVWKKAKEGRLNGEPFFQSNELRVKNIAYRGFDGVEICGVTRIEIVEANGRKKGSVLVPFSGFVSARYEPIRLRIGVKWADNFIDRKMIDVMIWCRCAVFSCA